MNKVTYLLGAGASANALPVVGNMNDRIDRFLNKFLKYQVANSNWKLVGINKLIDEYNLILLDAKQHATIDTFAKKLYLRKEFNRLTCLKTLISVYLIYEQTEVKETSNAYGEPLGLSSLGNGKLDSRYDAFLASTLDLKQDEISFNKNISIITWNYDYQIELAYSDYANCTLLEARQKLKIFPRENITSDNECNIVKLNGTVDLHDTIKELAGREGYFSSNQSNAFEYPAIHYALEIALKQCEQSSFHLVPSVCFAWENNINEEGPIFRAQKLLKESSTLVVIGYSFPVFNREVDKAIFIDSNINKVYLQSKSEHARGILSRIKNTINKPDLKVEIIEDLGQFYIPYEI